MSAPISKAEGQLIQLNEARTKLARVASVDEAKQIRDKAEALRHYAKQQKMGLDAQNSAAEIKIRAERRAGELLKEIERAEPAEVARRGGAAKAASRQPDAKQKRPDSTELAPTYRETIKAAGISEPAARRFQEIASLPEPAFEVFVETTKATGGELTSAATVKHAQAMSDNPVRRAKREVKDDTIVRLTTAVQQLYSDACVVEKLLPAVKKLPEARRSHLLNAVSKALEMLNAIKKEIGK